MAEVVVGDDILEQVLKRLDVKDLIRCKSVSKSWKSFISSPRFIKTHLNHSYTTDRDNNTFDHRRISLSELPFGVLPFPCFRERKNSYLLGSSNGLICICTLDAEIVVVNPCTREVKKLPQIIYLDFDSLCSSVMCCGFGYDSLEDDYKVVLRFRKGEYKTRFHVLRFKSNVWKVIGEVNYWFITKVGMLCNGALHWVMYPQNQKTKKAVILSFDLSHEDFKEIPQPDDNDDDDGLYRSLGIGTPHRSIGDDLPDMCLGVMEECLCVISPYKNHCYIWKMNIYNVKQSWETVGPERDLKYQLIHDHFSQLDKYTPFELFFHDVHIERYSGRELFLNPIFVPSLVSPHALFTVGQ